MIVEDDKTFHDLYEEMLDGKNYRIIHVYDGHEALEKLEDDKPDLIILDILLDMMTGDTFFLYLKSMPGYDKIPVIIVSNASRRAYKSLLKVDPNLVILDKTLARENLIGAIESRIEGQNCLVH